MTDDKKVELVAVRLSYQQLQLLDLISNKFGFQNRSLTMRTLLDDLNHIIHQRLNRTVIIDPKMLRLIENSKELEKK